MRLSIRDIKAGMFHMRSEQSYDKSDRMHCKRWLVTAKVTDEIIKNYLNFEVANSVELK